MGGGEQRAGQEPLNPPGARPLGRWRHPAVLVGAPLLLGLLHVALVAPHYHVGSFDDDASYILSAKTLLSGQGLSGRLASGEAMVGLYLPGYGALLVPFLWLWPHSVVDLRLLSAAGYAALFPLTWLLLRRRRVSDAAIAGALVLLALGPVLATFGSMVMAETPFLVALLGLLLLLDRWVASPRLVGAAGLGVIVTAAGLIWLKQAGLGLIVGLVLWLPFGPGRRGWARAGVLAATTALSVLPVLLTRSSLGIPLAGDRYSAELGGFYQGSLVERLEHVLPGSIWHLLSTAIPATLVPYLTPLPIGGHWPDLWKVLSWQVTVLCAVGAVTWLVRHRDAAVAMVVVYLGEAVLWPFVNERRAILIVPLLTAWYAIGAAATWRAVRRLAAGRRWPRPRLTGLRVGGVVLAAAVTVVPLVAQIPRDYLFAWGQYSSAPGGSRYMRLLAALGPASAVVETDYRSTVALDSGHPTAWGAFFDSTVFCYEPAVTAALAADRAAYLLLGDVNKPGVIDNACIAGLAADSPWAVPLLHTRRDNATVYELVGPGTAHPGSIDELASATPPLETAAGAITVWTWLWSAPVPVSQLSVGGAAALAGPTGSVRVQVRDGDGPWLTVGRAPSGIGDCGPCAPFFVLAPPRPLTVSAVRVVMAAPSGPAEVSDLAVIGPAGTATRS